MTITFTFGNNKIPVAGVKIIMTESDGTVTVLTTDSNGQVTLPTTSNTYTLQASLAETGSNPISVTDAIKILQHNAGLITLDADQIKAADTDGDGVLTVTDAIKVLQYNGGLITLNENLIFLDANTGKPLSEITFNPGDTPTISVIRLGDVDQSFDPTTITDHAPILTGKTTLTMDENETTVATLVGTDADGDSLTYSITGGADQDLFTIDASTGVLTFKAGPDYEDPLDDGGDNLYDVEITVSDGTNSNSQALIISVLDLNEKLKLTNKIINENEAGATVGDLSINDDDFGNDNITYELSGEDAEYFILDGTTIKLKSGVSADFETKSKYTLTVKATNASGDTITEKVVVKVNTAPTDISLFNDSIVEHIYGQTISVLNITDQNSGENFSYEIIGGDTNFFEVTDNGILKLKDNVYADYEYTKYIMGRDLTVTVRVTDQGGLSFDKTLTIKTTNVDYATPWAPDLWTWPWVVPSDDNEINALLMSKGGYPGYYVSLDPDNDPTTPLTVTYSLIRTDSVISSYYYGSDVYNYIVNGSEEWETMVDQAFEYWGIVSGINFVKVEETDTQVGDIRIGLSSGDFGNSGGWSWADLGPYSEDGFSYGFIEASQQGDIWIRADYDPINGGNYGPAILIHEIGHSIGLSHPFHDDFNSSLETSTNLYSVMAYAGHAYVRNEWDTDGDGEIDYYPQYLYAAKPSINDIKAVQYIYGVVPDHNEGDTEYIYRGPVYDTIYDTGGTDVIDLSYYSIDITFNLNGGTVSFIGTDEIWLSTPVAVGSSNTSWDNLSGFPISIAENTVIENLVTGSGNDKITCNVVANQITCGDGLDIVYDISTGDSVFGGGGNDYFHPISVDFEIIDGGEGFNYLALNNIEKLGSEINLDDYNNSTFKNIHALSIDNQSATLLRLSLDSVLNFNDVEVTLDVDEDGDNDYIFYIYADRYKDTILLNSSVWTFYKTITDEDGLVFDYYTSDGGDTYFAATNGSGVFGDFTGSESNALSSLTFEENLAHSGVGLATPVDVDQLSPESSLSYQISGEDASLFYIDSNNFLRIKPGLMIDAGLGTLSTSDASLPVTLDDFAVFARGTGAKDGTYDIWIYIDPSAHSFSALAGFTITISLKNATLTASLAGELSGVTYEQGDDYITLTWTSDDGSNSFQGGKLAGFSFIPTDGESPQFVIESSLTGGDDGSTESTESTDSTTYTINDSPDPFNITLTTGYYVGDDFVSLGISKDYEITIIDGEENSIYSDSSSEITIGTDKDDYIFHYGGDKRIDGGLGNDTLTILAYAGMSGYYDVTSDLSALIGTIYVDNSENIFGNFSIKTVSGITKIRVNPNAGSTYEYDDITLINVESISFYNNAYLRLNTELPTESIIWGSPDNESLVGTDGDDLIDSYGGSDQIDGGDGSDILAIFSSMANFDVQTVGGITKFYSAYVNYYNYTSAYWYSQYASRMVNVESIEFTDGSLEIDSSSPAENYIFGTIDSEVLVGTENSDMIDSAGGHDLINGYGGDDYLALFAEKNDFTFFGELLTIEGITKTISGWSYSEGISAAYNDYVITMIYVENVLFSDGESLEINTEINEENIYIQTFSDESISGTDQSDLIDSAGGDDYVDGLGGNDTLVIFEDKDKFEFFTVAGITRFWTNSGDLLGEYYNYGVVTSINVESIAFRDQTVEVVTDLPGTNIIWGKPSYDSLVEDLIGGDSDDIIDSFGGHDFINGKAGNDTLVIFSEEGNFEIISILGYTKMMGNTSTAYALQNDYNGYVHRVINVENIEFISSSLSLDALDGSWDYYWFDDYSNFALDTTDFFIDTWGENDFFDTGGGHDYVDGGGGSDTIAIFSNRSNFEVMTLGGITKIYGLNEVSGLGFGYYDHSIRSINVERIAFADEIIDVDVSLLDGNYILGGYWWEGSETIIGTDGDDIIDSNGGMDTVDGGEGEDTLILFANRDEFDIVVTAGGTIELTGKTSTMGWSYYGDTIKLTNVETIIFADQTVSVSSLESSNASVSQELDDKYENNSDDSDSDNSDQSYITTEEQEETEEETEDSEDNSSDENEHEPEYVDIYGVCAACGKVHGEDDSTDPNVDDIDPESGPLANNTNNRTIILPQNDPWANDFSVPVIDLPQSSNDYEAPVPDPLASLNDLVLVEDLLVLDIDLSNTINDEEYSFDALGEIVQNVHHSIDYPMDDISHEGYYYEHI